MQQSSRLTGVKVDSGQQYLHFFYSVRLINDKQFICKSLQLRHYLFGGVAMDFVYAGACVALWGAMVLMVWGFKKLEKPQGGRP
jgi:hypothetical protein